MSGGSLGPEEFKRLQAIVEQHEAKALRDRRYLLRQGIKRMAFGAFIGVVLAVIVTQLPPLGMVVVLWLVVAQVAYGLWQSRAMPCTVCGTRTEIRLPLPKTVPYVIPPWWDMRVPKRSDSYWLCDQDFLPFVQQLVTMRRSMGTVADLATRNDVRWSVDEGGNTDGDLP